MVYKVDARDGCHALKIRKGLIARPLRQPGKFLVFERVEDAIGHPSGQVQ
jgi:hypothetical protein